ncbi:aminotransferase class I/II-fold pyridoxal phosphate-dependent enzyme [Neolewinella antarctica]|uniref:8-amino-7-oxononanoate synthase n=1 Tax=Neolewinella antarctica TaxID=442734 RepID=A0ABX0XDZ5_9BACT|nr:pyridoxal phosphate-dependent aminotransferase family protein [Neolewinella antarctica]NJC27119.1 8-amino-7-oxononanoate synthase [Neolewinella antarctica]
MADFLNDRLERIRASGTYRELPGTVTGVDFWSNDYLGFARLDNSKQPFAVARGATGSRLISGDRDEWNNLEKLAAEVHGFPAGLMYNSGYTALLGLLAALLTRTDTIIYDELSHACCRDGIRLGHAKSLRFRHNDLLHLRQRLSSVERTGQVFVLTEGRFSMDGDVAPLADIVALCEEFNAQLIVDEAHSGGLEGDNGEGLVAGLNLQDRVFASVITYGKAFGTHGAIVLGSEDLRAYLVNTSRPFIYTTAMAATQWVEIGLAYKKLGRHHSLQYERLRYNVRYFKEQFNGAILRNTVSANDGPIQTVMVPGNEAVMQVEAACRDANLLVKGIRSPTVPAGSERLRICLHAFNTSDEIEQLVAVLCENLPNFGRS